MRKRRIYQHNSRRAIRIIIGSLEVGGAETHLSRILPSLAKKNWAIEVFTLSERKPNDLTNHMIQNGIKVNQLNWPNTLNFLPNPIKKTTKLALSCVRMLKCFIRDRNTLTHFFLPEAYLIGMTLARLSRLPAKKVMSRRSLNNYQHKWPLSQYLEKKFHRKLDLVLGNSQAICNQLHNDEKVPVEKTQLIYNGIELSPSKKADAYELHNELNIPKDTYLITIIANLIPYKGHADLLSACYQVNKQQNLNWALLIVGRDDGIGHELKQLANLYNIADKVHFLGVRTDVPHILSNADLGILCSHQEGFSNAILEAMIYKLPMVVTDVGGNAEAIINNKCGLVVPPHDPTALSHAILTMYNKPNQTKDFAKCAYERVTTCFSHDKCVEQYEYVYEQLTKDKVIREEQAHEFN